MTNHPNRGAKAPSSNPAPVDIIVARKAAGMTQTAAASIVYSSCRSWQQWEAGDRRMHPAVWELFKIKVEEDKLISSKEKDNAIKNLEVLLLKRKMIDNQDTHPDYPLDPN